jgi:hypothetical protein
MSNDQKHAPRCPGGHGEMIHVRQIDRDGNTFASNWRFTQCGGRQEDRR